MTTPAPDATPTDGSAPEGTAPYGNGPAAAAAPPKRVRIPHLQAMTDRGERWAMLTAYDMYAAQVFDRAGIETLVARWRAAAVQSRLLAKAKALSARLDKGETVEAVAAEAGLTVQSLTDLARNQAQGDLTAEVVNRVFATAVDKSASAEAGESRALFKVTAATMPPSMIPTGGTRTS